MRIRNSIVAIALLGIAACTGTADSPERTAAAGPTRVVVMIADGAGAAHWTLASFANDDLAVKRMKTVGLVDTRGGDHTVSGSAPTASAYATGVRTFMGAVSVGLDSLPRETVLEAALARGMSAGLMTTTAIVDATPAAFGAHSVNRSAFGDIARQLTSKDISVLLGGGRRAFEPETQPDSADLLADLRDEYTYVETIEELGALDLASVDKLLGLFAWEEMGVVADRGTALQVMTSAALTILDRDPEGFFLMIENEESDTQSHRNADEATITAEMLDFDRAVALALEYQAANPETLVVVTGDHETAGISLTYDDDREVVMQYAWRAHTGTLIPLFASGPGAERFGGVIRNDRVGQILMEIVRGQ